MSNSDIDEVVVTNPNGQGTIYDIHKAVPKEWNSGDFVAPPSEYRKESTPTVDSLPSFNEKSGNADLSVDTRALEYYADLLVTLNKEVEIAFNKMKTVEVRPGKFKAATDIGTALGVAEGKDSGTGAIAEYAGYLASLGKSLDGLSEALKALAKKYKTSEELNSVAASTALGEALTTFSTNLAKKS